jgi:beta-galactosidase/beta-glucuronidase
MSLNGTWRFDFDQGVSGLDECWQEHHDYTRKILVPFCPESRLSGIGDCDFHPACWYEREIAVPRLRGRRMILHFGASDYETTVFLNGQELGTHRGGYTPFSFDVTPVARPGRNRLTVYVRDDVRSRVQPAGKQSQRLESHGCHYTRTTGIWQTVWAELVPHCYVERVVVMPQAGLRSVLVEVDVAGSAAGALSARVEAKSRHRTVARSQERRFGGTRVRVHLDVPNARTWTPQKPFLHDLDVTLLERARPIDRVQSYFGMRTVELTDREFLLNGEPVYLKLVLDQGFYPDGIYTAPTDAALRRDIRLSQAAGYGGARLHQKVFEPRFLYWADRTGYLCWGEAPDWGLDLDNPVARQNLLAEWVEIVRRDVAHPCIVAWTAANEQHPDPTSGAAKGAYLASLQRTIKQLDPTRPVIDNSGYWHTSTDIVDIHDYSEGPTIRRNWARFARTNRPADIPKVHHPVMWPGHGSISAPVVLSEVGGIGFVTPAARGWGYGAIPRTETSFMRRFADTMRAVMSIAHTCGFCYTQFCDIEQETNGLYTYDRKAKFDVDRLRRIHEER